MLHGIRTVGMTGFVSVCAVPRPFDAAIRLRAQCTARCGRLDIVRVCNIVLAKRGIGHDSAPAPGAVSRVGA